jgi:hypothetical protein
MEDKAMSVLWKETTIKENWKTKTVLELNKSKLVINDEARLLLHNWLDVEYIDDKESDEMIKEMLELLMKE